MIKKSSVLKIIALVGLGFVVISTLKDKEKEKEDDKIKFLSNHSEYSNNSVKNFVSRVYKNVVKREMDNSTLISWTNKLLTKQITVYNFLVSISSSEINSVNISTLIQSIYMGMIGRMPNVSETSKLVSVFNSELRKYGSKERALRGMLTYLVKMSAIVSYCNKLGLRLI